MKSRRISKKLSNTLIIGASATCITAGVVVPVTIYSTTDKYYNDNRKPHDVTYETLYGEDTNSAGDPNLDISNETVPDVINPTMPEVLPEYIDLDVLNNIVAQIIPDRKVETPTSAINAFKRQSDKFYNKILECEKQLFVNESSNTSFVINNPNITYSEIDENTIAVKIDYDYSKDDTFQEGDFQPISFNIDGFSAPIDQDKTTSIYTWYLDRALRDILPDIGSLPRDEVDNFLTNNKWKLVNQIAVSEKEIFINAPEELTPDFVRRNLNFTYEFDSQKRLHFTFTNIPVYNQGILNPNGTLEATSNYKIRHTVFHYEKIEEYINAIIPNRHEFSTLGACNYLEKASPNIKDYIVEHINELVFDAPQEFYDNISSAYLSVWPVRLPGTDIEIKLSGNLPVYDYYGEIDRNYSLTYVSGGFDKTTKMDEDVLKECVSNVLPPYSSITTKQACEMLMKDRALVNEMLKHHDLFNFDNDYILHDLDWCWTKVKAEPINNTSIRVSINDVEGWIDGGQSMYLDFSCEISGFASGTTKLNEEYLNQYIQKMVATQHSTITDYTAHAFLELYQNNKEAIISDMKKHISDFFIEPPYSLQLIDFNENNIVVTEDGNSIKIVFKHIPTLDEEGTIWEDSELSSTIWGFEGKSSFNNDALIRIFKNYANKYTDASNFDAYDYANLILNNTAEITKLINENYKEIFNNMPSAFISQIEKNSTNYRIIAQANDQNELKFKLSRIPSYINGSYIETGFVETTLSGFAPLRESHDFSVSSFAQAIDDMVAGISDCSYEKDAKYMFTQEKWLLNSVIQENAKAIFPNAINYDLIRDAINDDNVEVIPHDDKKSFTFNLNNIPFKDEKGDVTNKSFSCTISGFSGIKTHVNETWGYQFVNNFNPVWDQGISKFNAAWLFDEIQRYDVKSWFADDWEYYLYNEIFDDAPEQMWKTPIDSIGADIVLAHNKLKIKINNVPCYDENNNIVMGEVSCYVKGFGENTTVAADRLASMMVDTFKSNSEFKDGTAYHFASWWRERDFLIKDSLEWQTPYYVYDYPYQLEWALSDRCYGIDISADIDNNIHVSINDVPMSYHGDYIEHGRLSFSFKWDGASASTSTCINEQELERRLNWIIPQKQYWSAPDAAAFYNEHMNELLKDIIHGYEDIFVSYPKDIKDSIKKENIVIKALNSTQVAVTFKDIPVYSNKELRRHSSLTAVIDGYISKESVPTTFNQAEATQLIRNKLHEKLELMSVEQAIDDLNNQKQIICQAFGSNISKYFVNPSNELINYMRPDKLSFAKVDEHTISVTFNDVAVVENKDINRNGTITMNVTGFGTEARPVVIDRSLESYLSTVLNSCALKMSDRNDIENTCRMVEEKINEWPVFKKAGNTFKVFLEPVEGNVCLELIPYIFVKSGPTPVIGSDAKYWSFVSENTLSSNVTIGTVFAPIRPGPITPVREAPKYLYQIRNADPRAMAYAPKLDPRELHGAMDLPRKDQGQQPLCSAYASSSALEYAIIRQNISPDKLSIANVYVNPLNIDYISNVRTSEADKLKMNPNDNFSEKLGDAIYIQQWIPAATNLLGPSKTGYNYRQPQAYLENAYAMNKYKFPEDWKPTTEEILGMKYAIAKYGSMISGVWFDRNVTGFERYMYVTPKEANAHNLGHALAIVGWDDSIPANKFKPRASRNGGWIVLNSWSRIAGDAGFLYLSYDTAFDELVALDVIDDREWDNAYYYDGNRINYGSWEKWDYDQFAVTYPVLKANSTTKEELKAVNISADPGGRVRIMIYKNNDINFKNHETGDPTSGELVAVQSAKLYRGTNTINLKEPIELDPNGNFTILVEPLDRDFRLLLSSRNDDTDTQYGMKNGKWKFIDDRTYRIKGYTKESPRSRSVSEPSSQSFDFNKSAQNNANAFPLARVNFNFEQKQESQSVNYMSSVIPRIATNKIIQVLENYIASGK